MHSKQTEPILQNMIGNEKKYSKEGDVMVYV
jgi:hypothetical protein